MLSQDYDEGARSEAGSERAEDPVGSLAVPEPRSPSAARLLEMTARETDQWRSDARAEAAGIVAAAEEQASALTSSAQREAEGIVEAARREAARAVDEAHATADEVRRETAEERAREEAEVARLQQIAADHSERLRQHLTDVLDSLESAPAQASPVRSATEPREDLA